MSPIGARFGLADFFFNISVLFIERVFILLYGCNINFDLL